MNKLLVFPLAMMFLLTIFAMTFTGINPTGNSENYSSQTGINVQSQNGTVDIPRAGSQTFNINTAGSIMIILITAIAVGILAGLKVLGSGLNETSQKMIFISILFLGMWACLSVVTSGLIFASPIALLLWSIITLMYIIGVGIQISSPVTA